MEPRPQGFSLKKWVGREKALENQRLVRENVLRFSRRMTQAYP